MIYIFGGAFDPPHAGHSAIIRSLLHYRQVEQIILLPSGMRNDKTYHVSDLHRLTMLDIFVSELRDPRVMIDDYFIRIWEGEMITRDVDLYVRERYGDESIHIFGTDTIASMPTWDSEHYAAKIVKKIFIPRKNDITLSLGQNPGIDISKNPILLSNIMEEPYYRFSPSQEEALKHIYNYELFLDAQIPDISSSDIRASVPKYATIHARYENNPQFMIVGLSKKISQYILRNQLYLPKQAKKPKILVHVCCGPDVTMPIIELRDQYEVICFWYDPNIQPKSEYNKRFDAFKRVCEIENIPYIKGAYDVDHFFSRIKGLEHTPEKGEKCTHCYDMRMYVAAKLAKKLGIKLYTSSLNTSPKKDLEKLFQMGHQYALKYGIEFLDIPFRKNGGFEKSVAYTTKHDIYRQNYCGCIYSIREGGESDMREKIVG